MEERIKQNAGTDRFGGNCVEFALNGDRSQFTVTYKVKGKRKTFVETYDFIETWPEVLDILKELDTSDHLDICTYYPEYFWLAKYHKEKLPEAKRGRH
jgi:hypothetical protein